jgi:ectoine hydroxylase-related dioxygenase (phytanoyl-CoA dioxygenase family)
LHPVITTEQRSQLAENGYFILESLFNAKEMEELTERIEAFQRKHEEEIRAKGGTEGISRANEISFTAFLAEQDEAIAAFTKRSEFVAITTQLLGENIDLYWNQSVFKAPEGAKEFPWHQDDGYTPVDPSPYLTLWLALNDATVENGCISVLPGSHKNGLVAHEQTSIGLVCYPSDAPNQGVPVPLKAGSIAVFLSLTFHKSGVNRSNGYRKAYIVQYSLAPLRNLRTGELMENRIAVARNGEAV